MLMSVELKAPTDRSAEATAFISKLAKRIAECPSLTHDFPGLSVSKTDRDFLSFLLYSSYSLLSCTLIVRNTLSL